MPNNEGFLGWDDSFLQGEAAYLDGLRVPQVKGLEVAPQEGTLWGLRTHANTMIAQRLYHGPEAPKTRRGIDITGSWKVFSKEFAEKLRSCAAAGAVFYFAPLDRRTDRFDAVSGETYKLTRPLARSIVPWVSAVSHPDKILLDGVVDPTAATISGQNVVANDTGEIEVHYTPIYRVIGRRMSESIQQANSFVVSFEFEEFVTF
jgi:hypothetical protein